MGKDTPTYQEILEHNPDIGGYFFDSDWDFCDKTNDITGDALADLWCENAVKNAKLLPAHGLMRDGCVGAGFNKAAILIGAGPSVKKHMDFLKELCFFNAAFPFYEQPFLFVATNHQFKPCLEHGIIPHFVILGDASDVVYPQLCKGIPGKAKGTILLAPMRADPKTVAEWDRQGRAINFMIGRNKKVAEALKPELGINPLDANRATIIFGGNVMNLAMIALLSYSGCTSFIAVGNDLSYDPQPTPEEREKAYYGDGDYSTNKATGRDEANKNVVAWMGYELDESIIAPGHFILRYKPKCTANTLLSYKMWLEVRVGVQEKLKHSFHYFNCSETGILGVLSRKPRIKLGSVKEAMEDQDNWFMIDELFPKRYHTWTLNAAVNMFIKAWEKAKCQKNTNVLVVPGAGTSEQRQSDSVGDARQSSSGKRSSH